MQIFKYELTRTQQDQTLLLPKGPILDVQVQDNRIVLWTSNSPERVLVHFRLVMTGEEFDPKDYTFLKTVQLDNGAYVYHIFKIKI